MYAHVAAPLQVLEVVHVLIVVYVLLVSQSTTFTFQLHRKISSSICSPIEQATLSERASKSAYILCKCALTMCIHIHI